ncbi:MAG: hypothetical protein D8M58_01665 [Calditrichaeota bacterium]|nr:MAG: hypothetical protein DWQ03_05415 [Calditrichota bacterium]MBL1204075.1 hypothetical protein [Calditrichota bacterium]NOG43906.1 type II toxin-antitoxin system MqsA family antitoxin [Calditrichota bacterium]
MRELTGCPLCGSEDLTKEIGKKEIIKIRNEKIEVISNNSIQCDSCKESITSFKSEDELINEARQIYREKKNIPSPTDIINFKKQYNLGFRDFEELTGIANKTLQRYIKGAIPDPSTVKLLVLLMNDPEIVVSLMSSNPYFDKQKFQSIIREWDFGVYSEKREKFESQQPLKTKQSPRKKNQWQQHPKKNSTDHLLAA